MTYYYGGSVTGREIVPEESVSSRVPITNSIPDAALLALSVQGYVCEVKPVGKVTPDRDGEKGVNFVCKRAKIVRILSWSEVRAHIKIRVAGDIEAQNQEEPVRDENALQ